MSAALHGREITEVAAAHPDRPAIVAPGRTVTYAELDQRAERVAGAIQGAGIAPGESVAVLCTNRPEWIEVFQGALRSGVRLVPINWHLPPDDVAYVIADSGSRALFAEAELAPPPIEGAQPPLRVAIGGDLPGFADHEQVLADAPAADPDRTRGSLMIYTSGTTGRPKGVTQAAPAATEETVAAGSAMAQLFGMDGDRGDVMLCPAPLYHSGPSRIGCEWPLGAGVTVVLPERFDASEALRLLGEHRITHAFFVPTMFERMLALPAAEREAADVSHLRFVLHGAGPITVATKQAMFDWFGPVIHEIYAASEGPGTWITPEEWLAHPGSVGRTDPERIEIRDAGPDGIGTVWFRATHRWQYHGDPDKTARTFDETGQWYTVGDLGRIDGDGYLHLHGRTAEVIVSGGVNLYPARIDEALADHPEIADAAAFGEPDPEYGEVVAAAVVPTPGTQPTPDLAERIIAHCRRELGSQMAPRRVHFVDELPRSDAGKLYRTRLRNATIPGGSR